MNINEADELVRKKIGKRCGFKSVDTKPGYGMECTNGFICVGYGDLPDDEICPHCHGTGYEPIGLADVLMGLAVKEPDVSYLNNENIYIGILDDENLRYTHKPILWNLTKPYEYQEESVRIKIAQLIKD